jgi:hypothetical protein
MKNYYNNSNALKHFEEFDFLFDLFQDFYGYHTNNTLREWACKNNLVGLSEEKIITLWKLEHGQ